MTDIIVPANIRAYRSDAAEEMSGRDPLDTDTVSFLDGALVPAEVLDTVAKAAERRGIEVSRYVVDMVYKSAIYDLSGSGND